MATLNIYKKGSVLYLKNGLPPLIPGTSISPTGIVSYMLTKEEASSLYYDKTTSDTRYVNAAGDLIEGQIFEVPKHSNSIRYLGIRFVDDADRDIKSGFGWLNNEATPELIAWLTRESTSTNSKVEVAVCNEDGTNPMILSLKSDGTFTVNKTKTISNSGDVLTWATGIKKHGDIIEGGTYEYRAGKFSLKSLTDVEGVFREVLVVDYLNDGVRDVLDLKGNYIKGSGSEPTSDDELASKGYVAGRVDRQGDTIFDWLTYDTSIVPEFDPTTPPDDAFRPYRLASVGYVDLKSVGTYFDAVVSTDPGIGEYATVRDAMLDGKRKIKILPGTYSATLFWPYGDSIVLTDSEVVIEGSGKGDTIISGANLFTLYSGYSLANITIRDLTFSRNSSNIFQLGGSYNAVKHFKIENCKFTGTAPIIGFITNGNLLEDNALTFEKCIFENTSGAGIYMSNVAPTSPIYNNVLKIRNNYFYNNIVNIYLKYRLGNVIIDSNTFELSAASSTGISVEAQELTGASDKISKIKIINNIFGLYGNTSKGISVLVSGTANLNGGHYFIYGNTFKADTGVTTPYSIFVSANTPSLSGSDLFRFYVSGNEMYGFSESGSTGVKVSGATTTISTAMFISGFSQIVHVSDVALPELPDLANSNIIL